MNEMNAGKTLGLDVYPVECCNACRKVEWLTGLLNVHFVFILLGRMADF